LVAHTLLIGYKVKSMSFWLWKMWFAPWLLERWDAKAADTRYSGVSTRLVSLAQQMRLSPPKLYVVRDFSPNAIFLIPHRKLSFFIVTDGLLQVLNADELDAVFCHGLAQIKFWQFRVAPWFVLVLYPIESLLAVFPKLFSLLLSLWPRILARFFLSPKRFAKADQAAIRFHQAPHALAAALQKCTALSRKIPLRTSNWAWDHLCWISPAEMGFPAMVRTHPPTEQRLAALLKQ
jgi:heat shock protein HtpX